MTKSKQVEKFQIKINSKNNDTSPEIANENVLASNSANQTNNTIPPTESTPEPKPENAELTQPTNINKEQETPPNDTYQADYTNPQLNLLSEESNNNTRWIMIFSIIVGILLIGAGFALFKYFNSEDNSNNLSGQTPIANVENHQESPDDSSGIIAGELDSEGIVANNGGSSGIATGKSTLSPTTNRTPNQISSQNQEAIKPANKPNSSNIPATNSKMWTANDYKKGDIEASPHKVISGDTLWEIAEAYYGNGNAWTKIAQANNITNLPNGNPLITPGMILTLPSP